MHIEISSLETYAGIAKKNMILHMMQLEAV
jgi:hypothetical protein